jgi:hypothetical protein
LADARYFRSQAEFCHQIAQRIRDRKDADNRRTMAEKSTEQARAEK